MRSHRMRGYGSWCMGWRDAERNPGPPPGNNGGCGILFFGFMALVVFSFFKVALETGNGMGIILGLAVVAGVIKGMSK
jgi:hypothetical protein